MADLVTLAETREFLQKQTGQTGTDAALSSLITRASAVIQREIDTFITPNEATTHTLEWDGSGRIGLLPYVMRSLSAVTLDPDEASETVLSASQYRLGPEPAKDGVYTYIEVDVRAIPAYTGNFATRRAEIAGYYGYAAVPDGLKHACLMTVTAWYRSRVSGFSTAYEGADGADGAWSELIPRDAFRVLNQWRRYSY